MGRGEFFRLYRSGGFTALKQALDACTDQEIRQDDGKIFAMAVEGGYLDVVKYLFEERQLNPNDFVEDGFLSDATGEGYLNVTKYLVEKCQVDLHVWNERALLWAARRGDGKEIVEYLLEKGADYKVFNPLELAYSVCHEVAQDLKQRKAQAFSENMNKLDKSPVARRPRRRPKL